VYHSDQITKLRDTFLNFKQKLIKENKLNIVDFDLAKFTTQEIEWEYVKMNVNIFIF
jgi:hypothetical protein